MTILAAINFPTLLFGLAWGVMVVLNLWLWQKSKAQGNLLMLIGAALLAFMGILGGFGASLGLFVYEWFPVIGTILIVAGFYMTVKALVAANIAGLKAKAQAISKKEGGGTSATP
jgi:hypothetical protein